MTVDQWKYIERILYPAGDCPFDVVRVDNSDKGLRYLIRKVTGFEFHSMHREPVDRVILVDRGKEMEPSVMMTMPMFLNLLFRADYPGYTYGGGDA